MWKRQKYQLRRLLQPISSSPRGQSRLPSHTPDLDIQILLSLHLNACTGQWRPVHSSSEPSAQSVRPSQTKNQLMQLPDDRHWNVPGAQPVRRALQLLFVEKLQSHTPPMHRDIWSAIRHSKSATHGSPKLIAVIIVLSWRSVFIGAERQKKLDWITVSSENQNMPSVIFFNFSLTEKKDFINLMYNYSICHK